MKRQAVYSSACRSIRRDVSMNHKFHSKFSNLLKFEKNFPIVYSNSLHQVSLKLQIPEEDVGHGESCQ
jgi:hypothetical protein